MKIVFILYLLLTLMPATALANCTLTMGFTESAKMPLINEKGDDSGVFLELFSTAANNIGCDLEVVRLPKKRLHKMFAQGQLDFYPGASFSLSRESYLFYMPNGLSTAEYGVTHLDIKEIDSYKQLSDRKLIWLQEIGSSKVSMARQLDVEKFIMNKLNIDMLKNIMNKRRNVFAVIDKESHDYYRKENTLVSLESIGLKVHKNCCLAQQPMYLGFSKYSPHFKSLPNPDFNKYRVLSPTNLKLVIDQTTIAYKLSQALRELESSGTTQEIYNAHFNH